MVGQAAAAGLILPDVARELIMPSRTIFLPPAGGWSSALAGRVLSPVLSPWSVEQITRETLRILSINLRFIDSEDRSYDSRFPFKASDLEVRHVRWS